MFKSIRVTRVLIALLIIHIPSAAYCCHMTKFCHKEYELNLYLQVFHPHLKRKWLAFHIFFFLHPMNCNVYMVLVPRL